METESTSNNNIQEKQKPSEKDEDSRSEEEQNHLAKQVQTESQMVFDNNGELEPETKTTDVSLEHFDVNIEKNNGETRMAEPEASGIMCDDREQTSSNKNEGEQASLFTDTAEDQATLTGEKANNQFLFDEDGQK